MLPVNSSFRVARISVGATQLLVGPASSSRSLQMKVRSSTRATSLGSLRARKLNGRCSGLRRMSVPRSTRSFVTRSNSAALPSHQTTSSGWVIAAMRATHSMTRTSVPAGLSKNAPCLAAPASAATEAAAARASAFPVSFGGCNVVVMSRLSVVCYSLRRELTPVSRKVVVKTPNSFDMVQE